MKKLFTLIGAAALAFLSTSCLQQHTTLSLNKDGSGTITETTVFGAQMLGMLAQAGEAGDGADPVQEMINKAKANADETAKSMGEGVSIKEIKALNEGGKTGMIVIYEFKDINKLKYSIGQSLGDGGEENEPIEFSYKDGVLTINNDYEQEKGAEDAAAGEDEFDEQGMAMAKMMMGDMRISFNLEFPGGIAETNAEHVDGNKVTVMDVDFGKLMAQEDKFKEFMQKEPGTPAEAKEMLKGADGVTIETADKLTIKLK